MTYLTHRYRLSVLLIVWLLYASLYVALKNNTGVENYAGILSLVGQVGLDLVALVYAGLLWRKDKENNILFFILASSFFFAILADGIYNFLLNVHGLVNPSVLLSSLYEIPFLSFLILQSYWWGRVASKLIYKQDLQRAEFSYLSLVIVGLITLLTFLFGYDWQVKKFSITGFYHVADTVFESAGFIFATISLVAARKLPIVYLSIGYLLVMVADLTIRYSVVTNTILPRHPFEAVWILGLSLMTYGLYLFYKTLSLAKAKEKENEWLYPLRSVRVQSILWGLTISTFSLLIFLIVDYISSGVTFYSQITGYLPAAVVAFSLFIVLLSMFFAQKITDPFIRLDEITNAFLNPEATTIQAGHLVSKLPEFRRLEQCLVDSFNITKQKLLLEKRISDLALQVAHDIRSPLTALEIAIKQTKHLPEEQRILIRKATQHIQDIANNLLTQYKIQTHIPKTKEITHQTLPELVIDLIQSVFSEVRLQHYQKPITFNLEVEATHANFADINSSAFKRVMSNIINNAVESIPGQGEITIRTKRDDDQLLVVISDTGCGIAKDNIPLVRQGTSLGKDGMGLGIPNAIEILASWGGKLEIDSQIGRGTNIILCLPITKTPSWFSEKIVVHPNIEIAVLDDDDSIHAVWRRRFLDVGYKEQSITDFYTTHDLSNWHKQKSSPKLYLIDYELIGQKESGLDIIEALDISHCSRLVTSRYEEPELRERCEQLGVKIIPKSFAAHIPIEKLPSTPDIIFIDDDKDLTDAWKYRAKIAGKSIAVFNNIFDFKINVFMYSADTPIYIDSDLQDRMLGQELAKCLYKRGFKNLYLATGYEKSHFEPMDWIKAVVGKIPPF